MADIGKLTIKVRVLFKCRWFMFGVLTPPKGPRMYVFGGRQSRERQ